VDGWDGMGWMDTSQRGTAPHYKQNKALFTTNQRRCSVCAQIFIKLSAAPTHSSKAYGETDQQHYLCRA
jgi:hypothetical protein